MASRSSGKIADRDDRRKVLSGAIEGLRAPAQGRAERVARRQVSFEFSPLQGGMVVPTGGITPRSQASFAEKSECLDIAPLYTFAVHARVDHVVIWIGSSITRKAQSEQARLSGLDSHRLAVRTDFRESGRSSGNDHATQSGRETEACFGENTRALDYPPL